MKFYIVYFLIFIFFFQSAMAKSPSDTNTKNKISTMMDLKSFNRLSLAQKISYLKAIQNFVVKSDFSKDPRFKASLVELFIEKTYAIDDQSPCLFAGFLMDMKQTSSGKWYCPKPPRDDCPVGQVRCNPLVFPSQNGKNGVCVGEPFKDATEHCLRASNKDLSSLVSRLDSDSPNFDQALADGWINFRDRVKDYCLNPFPFNEKNCETMRAQFGLIQEKLLPTAQPTAREGSK